MSSKLPMCFYKGMIRAVVGLQLLLTLHLLHALHPLHLPRPQFLRPRLFHLMEA